MLMLAIAAVVFAGLPVYLVVVLAIIATCFSAFFSPAIGAYLPSLVSDESELGPANSAWSSLDNLAFFIGPAFGALLLGLGLARLGIPAQRRHVRLCRADPASTAAVGARLPAPRQRATKQSRPRTRAARARSTDRFAGRSRRWPCSTSSPVSSSAASV